MQGLDFLGGTQVAKPSRAPMSLSGNVVALGAGAVGAILWRRHPVLGFLGGSALASNVHALATKNRTFVEAGKRMGKHFVAVAGSLALPSHPAVGYVAGAVAGDLLLDGAGGGIIEEWAHFAGVQEPQHIEILDMTSRAERDKVYS